MTPLRSTQPLIVQRAWRLCKKVTIAQARAKWKERLREPRCFSCARRIECRAMSYVIYIPSQQQPRDIIAAVLSAVRSD